MEVRGRTVSDIYVVIIIGVAVRLLMSPFFKDIGDFAYWASAISNVRTGGDFYTSYDFWYPPVWGYVMSLTMPILDLFNIIPTMDLQIDLADGGLSTGDGWSVSNAALVIIKLPLIIADAVNAILIYNIVKKITNDERKALFSATLWMFVPLSMWVSAGQGQFDSLSLTFTLLSVSAYLDRQYIVSGMSIATAIFTKVFPVFVLLPMLALILVRESEKRTNYKNASIYIISGILMSALLLLPQIVTGEIEYVLSFFSSRFFDASPVPSGFDPWVLALTDESLYPGTGGNSFLLPSFLIVLAISVYIIIRKPKITESIILLTASVCVYLMWIPSPGYIQYYILPLGFLCICSCIDRRFGYLAIVCGIVCVLHLITSVGHLEPTLRLGLISTDTLDLLKNTIGSVGWAFDGIIKILRCVPMILAVILSFMICRRSADES